MSDIYNAHADVITDELMGSPGLFEPVSAEFASNSDDGYGQWVADDHDSDTGVDEGDRATADPYDSLHRRGRDLTDDEQSDLDELQRVMSGPPDQSLLSGTGRGAYVHRDDDSVDDDVAEDVGDDAAAGLLVPAAHKPWWRFGWFDHRRRTHRLAAIGAVAVVALAVAALVLPGGGEKSTSSSATTTPAFTVPTVTQTTGASPAPGAPAPGNDGPVGIKRADSRCTAGSTDPMQAFDNDVNTAWLCVPAYGVPGTVLRVEFDNWYVVTGVSIVPGWNRVNPDGSDEWIKHKTAATVEYQFNDPDQTRLTQQTNNIRDEVVTPVQPPVLASAMTITITGFGTPTGPVANTTDIPGQGGVIVSDTPKTGDLKDFAISSISVIGHRAA
jgi:hypothetical protein